MIAQKDALLSIGELENKRIIPIGILLAVALPLVYYVLLKLFPGLELYTEDPTGHFYIVSLAAIFATTIAMSIGWLGTRLRNIQVTLVALAFVSLGIMFALHGLTTPGFILSNNRVVSVSSPLGLLLCAYWLFLSSLATSTNTVRTLAKLNQYLLLGWTSLLLITSLTFFSFPSLADNFPIYSAPLKLIAGFVALELFVITAWRYWKSYLYTHAPLQLALVYSAAWLALAQIIVVSSTLWYSTWWSYHFLLLAATLTVFIGLAKEYLRGISFRAISVGLWERDPIARLEAAISPGVKSLIVKTEEHDNYTAGHNKRVASLAVQLGQTMKLSPKQLRALAQGGIVHDLGKLSIPKQILNKPGKLTDEERAVIEKHPTRGWNLAKKLGFMPEELAIIRYHHERWDGEGYPSKLAGDKIPLLARITAIADVYDALTSKRSYRDPWSHERAHTYILEQAGKQFCPQCVEAWKTLMAEGPQAVGMIDVRRSQVLEPVPAFS